MGTSDKLKKLFKVPISSVFLSSKTFSLQSISNPIILLFIYNIIINIKTINILTYKLTY